MFQGLINSGGRSHQYCALVYNNYASCNNCIMEASMLTQAKLKSLINYNPVTGEFSRAGYAKCGTLTYQGYLAIQVAGKRYYAHRLAWFYMTGKWPEDEIDHKNRIRNDNRWENLREADRYLQSTNRSGYKWAIRGISYQKGGWNARIGRKHYVGRFKCLGKAIRARAQAIKDLEQ